MKIHINLKYIILFEFLIYALSTTLRTIQVGDCINKKCNFEIDYCKADEICSKSLECISNCLYEDDKCFGECYIPVQKNPQFWSLDLCSMNCWQSIGNQKEIDLQSCEKINCAIEIQSCLNDLDCVTASECLKSCGTEGDYICGATCIIESNSQALLDILKCNADCFFNYL